MSTKIATGGGETHFYEGTLLCDDKPNLANVIAGELVNEILENALDIATCSNETGIPWKEITTAVNESNATAPKHKIEEHKSDVCVNIVGDIINRMGIAPKLTMEEILDSLNSINQSSETPKEPQMPLQAEMKILLSEMLSNPYQINFDVAPVKGAVGDQPFDQVTPLIIQEGDLQKTVEKKSRVTDLIKNSPHLITEYLLDEQARHDQDTWEENEEHVIQVIELDHVKPGEEYLRTFKEYNPENVPLPEDDDDILEVNNDVEEEEKLIRVIKLSPTVCRLEPQIHTETTISSGTKGDCKNQCTNTVNPPPDTDSCSEESIIVVSDTNEKQKDVIEPEQNLPQKKAKKKKWNLGSRLLKFFKKGHKKESESTSVQNSL